MNILNIELGQYILSDATFEFELVKNDPSTVNTNTIICATQGTGKTNLFMLITYSLYKKYIDSDFKYGAIPVVFAPMFEFTQLNIPSKSVNLPPGVEPEGISGCQYTFKLANPPEDNPDIKIIRLNFRELTVEDICSFAGYSDDNKVLGYTQKLIENLARTNPDYTVDDFIQAVEEFETKTLKDALYYVFTKLKDSGLFDEGEEFDWLTALRQLKPICINFGEIDEKSWYNSLCGILLRKLWRTSIVYYNAYLKSLRPETAEDLSDDEQFLLKHFSIALLVDEGHQILYNSPSITLTSFPAHHYFKKIASLMGRKRMFKYNFIVTQAMMEIYHGFRKKFNYLCLGSEVFEDDKSYFEKELKFLKEDVLEMTNNQKHCWSFTNISDYKKRKKFSVHFFKAYLSPCGQPK